MKDFIERLRAKPVSARHGIAFASSASVTAIIAVVWMSSVLATHPLSISTTPAASGGLQVADTGTPSNTANGADSSGNANGSGNTLLAAVAARPSASDATGSALSQSPLESVLDFLGIPSTHQATPALHVVDGTPTTTSATSTPTVIPF